MISVVIVFVIGFISSLLSFYTHVVEFMTSRYRGVYTYKEEVDRDIPNKIPILRSLIVHWRRL